MRYTFQGDHAGLGPKHFEGAMRSTRCKCKTHAGRRCKRIVTIGYPYCPAHTRIRYGVRIALSDIPGAGRGLFACRDFCAGARIAPYVGERVRESTLVKRYGSYSAPYALEIVRGVLLDSALVRGVASMANGHYGSAAGDHNAEFIIDEARMRGYLVASRDIRAGEEIIVHYGPDYAARAETLDFSHATTA